MHSSQHRVILIGGTSHAGKSTLAEHLASKFGWESCSTDKLARHPGRPWGANGKRVPEHVAEHYSSLSVDQLVVDVLEHYEKNVMPQVQKIVHHQCTDPAAECLILEGSALWPEFVADWELHRVGAVWLAASDELVRARIYEGSGYAEAPEDQRFLIQKFLDRTLLYNQRMRSAVRRLGLDWIDTASTSDVGALAEELLGRVRAQGSGAERR